MLQLTTVLVCVVVGSACALWVFALRKLLPLYRSGAIQGGWRLAFQFVCIALSWVTMQIVVWLFLRQDAATMMLNVLWAIALLSWVTLSTLLRTAARRGQTLAAETEGLDGYTVRSAAQRVAEAQAGRQASYVSASAIVRGIEGMEVE